MIELSGKCALVTGGSRGIGAATAVLLAQTGCNVAITFSTHKKDAEKICRKIESTGSESLAIRANVVSESGVRRTVDRVVRRFGRLDILVNNAGIWKRAPVGRMTVRQWDETLDINLRSVFLFCREASRVMRRRGGKIINVASTAGQRGEPNYSHYAASKAGIIAFTKSFAVEAARLRIGVNCVAPGWVETDMTAGALGTKRRRNIIEAGIPRGRVATPEEIAGPILFLASNLSDHMVGATLSVNGGGVLVT